MNIQRNAFQLSIEQKIKKNLQERNVDFETRYPKDRNDIDGVVGGYEFWIYDDGACIIGPGFDKVYEIYDYGTLEDLGNKFIEDLLWTIDNHKKLKEPQGLKSRSIVQKIKGFFSKK